MEFKTPGAHPAPVRTFRMDPARASVFRSASGTDTGGWLNGTSFVFREMRVPAFEKEMKL
jgi:hypothetical protein